MALSERWVERIFARMLVRYGAAWLRMWEGVPMDAVRADWADELSGFEANPNAIKHALDNLPADKPPTVAQFKAACLKAPEFAPKALPAPKADPAVVAAAVSAVRPKPVADAKAWAHRMQADEQAGARLTAAQRRMWRDALRSQPATGVGA